MSSISLRASSARRSSRKYAVISSARLPGIVKQIDCSDDACEISDTETCAVRECAEHARRYAGDAEHAAAAHGDHRLVGHAGDRAYRRAFDRSAGDDRRSVRREIGERTQSERRAAEQRHERARMQNLGAVVCELRRLADVEELHDPRARDEPRIGRHDAGDVLP